jgi:FkbM family methyltransferase
MDLNQNMSYWGFVDCGGFRMLSGGNDDLVALRFKWANYEKHSIALWKNLCKGTVLDIGAHTGAYTLAALTQGAEVYSFEPNIMAFARLNLNLRANFFPTDKAFPVAVGEETGLARLQVSLDPSFLSSGGAIAEQGIEVPMVNLDRFFTRTPTISAIKIDTEGFEEPCLKGMSDILQQRPAILFECIQESNIMDLLQGYRFYLIDEQTETLAPVDTLTPQRHNGKPIAHLRNRLALYETYH